eukprot:scaffold15551_cov43-Cyclotella_meneghiniana.AAC.1
MARPHHDSGLWYAWIASLWVMVMVRHGSFVSPQPPDLPGPTRTCHLPHAVKCPPSRAWA